jgi:hypothetical protein
MRDILQTNNAHAILIKLLNYFALQIIRIKKHFTVTIKNRINFTLLYVYLSQKCTFLITVIFLRVRI